MKRLAAVGLAVLLAACSPRADRAPAPAPPGSQPAQPPGAVPPTGVPTPPPGPMSDRERDAVLFSRWRGTHAPDVDAFEEFLVREHVAQVVPTYQLLRSASMWKECKAEPFEVPPATSWPAVRDVLLLLRELQQRQVLPGVEVVSAYRDPRLNLCAGGAPHSAHTMFAVDLAPLGVAEGDRLCRFWREQGPAWQMGVSRYPTGRIHIDRQGWRTWGASHRRASSYCLD